MKTIFSDKLGARDRKAYCALVTKDGRIYKFDGSSIDGVCHAKLLAYKKDGRKGYSVWEITHAETTFVVQWREDFETGRPFPQLTWEEGYFWMAEQAPLLSREAFEAFVRKYFSTTAARWDQARKAEEEFGFAATPEEIAMIRAAQARIAAEKAAYEEEQRRKRENSPYAALLAVAN